LLFNITKLKGELIMLNTPNSDVNSPETNDISETDIENKNDTESDNEEIPIPPGGRANAPVEEPPETRKSPINENTNEPTRLV
jgi:hypothetical protein